MAAYYRKWMADGDGRDDYKFQAAFLDSFVEPDDEHWIENHGSAACKAAAVRLRLLRPR